MALNSSWSTTARNAAHAGGLTPEYAGGKFRGYGGTRPANADAALSGNTLLFECTLGSPAFGSPSAGLATANAITQDSSANASGTATWFRIVTSASAFVIDGSVSTSGSDLNLTTTTIVATQPVSVTSFTITEGTALVQCKKSSSPGLDFLLFGNPMGHFSHSGRIQLTATAEGLRPRGFRHQPVNTNE